MSTFAVCAAASAGWPLNAKSNASQTREICQDFLQSHRASPPRGTSVGRAVVLIQHPERQGQRPRHPRFHFFAVARESENHALAKLC